VLGTAVDVTAQRLLDSRLRSADRLIAAGTLAAGVAHEINNPLTYVLGNIDLLRMQPARPRARREPGAGPDDATASSASATSSPTCARSPAPTSGW
jgi:signal transduction histidine kinase